MGPARRKRSSVANLREKSEYLLLGSFSHVTPAVECLLFLSRYFFSVRTSLYSTFNIYEIVIPLAAVEDAKDGSARNMGTITEGCVRFGSVGAGVSECGRLDYF